MEDNKKPRHIAIIMDGNGRWAQEKSQPRIMGHKRGVEVAEDILEASLELGIEFLTLYTFSSENWKRPKAEVDILMEYLSVYLDKAKKDFNEKGIRLLAIGEINKLPEITRKKLFETIETTRNNKKLTLTLALSYGSRQEIVNATKKILKDVLDKKVQIDNINENLFSKYLYTAEIPDPDLLIRTSNELRLSNFLLWQISYAEFYFSNKYWPEFTKDDLIEAIKDYGKRQRRYGNI
jgi:undecaprenyl diphosphate synthase